MFSTYNRIFALTLMHFMKTTPNKPCDLAFCHVGWVTEAIEQSTGSHRCLNTTSLKPDLYFIGFKKSTSNLLWQDDGF